MVDITTNNYQKAIESFFSHYCSYALNVYFAELAAVKKVKPTAEARIRLLKAGLPTEVINEDGTLDMDFQDLATEYWVRVVPGSLVEMEDEKQMRILNELFIPLSQAMPALANSGDPQMLQQAAKAMQYIIAKQIELSGSTSAKDIGLAFSGDVEEVNERDRRIAAMEEEVHTVGGGLSTVMQMHDTAMTQMQEQIGMLREAQELILERLGGSNNMNSGTGTEMQQDQSTQMARPTSVLPASA
jgi:hypothetical protein